MTHKELLIKIEEMLKSGADLSQIYSAVGRSDDNARIVAATPPFDKRERYRKLNFTLVFIVIYFAIAKFFLTLFNFIAIGLPFYIFPITLIVPACAVAMGIGIMKFRGYFYLPVGLLGIVAILRGLNAEVSNYDLSHWALWFAINVPVAFGSFLAFYLRKKLCPYLGYMGAKTDDNGHYLFLHEQANKSPS